MWRRLALQTRLRWRRVNQELETQEGTLDDVISHGLFANLHYRFGGQRWQPYVGVGLGFSRAFVDHATYWQRNDNPEYITTFEDPALRAKVAGTITIGDARHSDTVLGYQLIVGVDRPAERIHNLERQVPLGALRRLRGQGHRVGSATQPRIHSRPRRAGAIPHRNGRSGLLGCRCRFEIPVLATRDGF